MPHFGSTKYFKFDRCMHSLWRIYTWTFHIISHIRNKIFIDSRAIPCHFYCISLAYRNKNWIYILFYFATRNSIDLNCARLFIYIIEILFFLFVGVTVKWIRIMGKIAYSKTKKLWKAKSKYITLRMYVKKNKEIFGVINIKIQY